MKIISVKNVLVTMLATAFVMFTGCPSPVADNNNPSGEKTLVQQVVDELAVALSPAGRTVSDADITAIKTAALKQIADDNLSGSQELDKILPSMIAGAAIGSKNLGEGMKADVYTIVAKSSLESLGKPERSTKLSSGKSLVQTIGFVSEATVNVVVANLTGDAASASLKSVSKATVKVVSTNEGYKAVADAAVSASVTGSLRGLDKGSTDTVAMAAMMVAFESILEASFEEASVTRATTMSAVLSAVNSDVTKSSTGKGYAAAISTVSIKASVKIAVSVAGTDSAKAAELIKNAVSGQKKAAVILLLMMLQMR